MPAYHAPERQSREHAQHALTAPPPEPAEDATEPTWERVLSREPRTAAAPEPTEWRPPPPLRERIRRAVTVPVVAGVAVFAAAIVIAIIVVWARPHAPADAHTETPEVAETVPPTPGDDAASISADGTAFIHVVGEVASPGVVELAATARVQDAIDAAGGPTKEAVLSGVNLARPVVDGEQIVVPDTAGASTPAPAAPEAAGPADGTGVVNLNTADAAALETLPRVGPALAQRIIEWRDANGPFASVDQLLEVSGIGEKTLEGFRDQVAV